MEKRRRRFQIGEVIDTAVLPQHPQIATWRIVWFGLRGAGALFPGNFDRIRVTYPRGMSGPPLDLVVIEVVAVGGAGALRLSKWNPRYSRPKLLYFFICFYDLG